MDSNELVDSRSNKSLIGTFAGGPSDGAKGAIAGRGLGEVAIQHNGCHESNAVNV